MSYYDNKMMSEVESGRNPSPLDDTSGGAEDTYRPFRRKAALRDEPVFAQRQQPVAPHILTEEVRVETLPAVLPNTWEQLQIVSFGMRDHIRSRAPLVNFFRETPTARAFDILRTRLLQTLKHEGWRRVAIVAPTSGCGATFTAVNLALSLARVPDSRTVLMDMNMRDPGVKSTLDIAAPGRQQDFLDGQIAMKDHLVRCSDTLAVGLADEASSNASELLQSQACSEALDAMIEDTQPDVVLYDLPPVLAHDDLTAFMNQIDGVLLVSDGEQTTSDQIKACEKIIGGHVPLLGVILNRGRGSRLEAYAS
ncbi:Tyrosine-protein kinase YwqD [Falsiruegeria litorea R37]|uniref:Tyrosine-protein kinase YwqD n=1 Tax=Falsiruegeria litorea R37 TaxID=1200284 RepID=A0A1Y5T0D1_9RHOB|nr:CpsD/CapB family tyrosine-protein kinase [Falsiruegeria litorea]SLN53073.1 Tyrosine-protein kinase YwqD [Falsiruegeria litorea R37]